ncbi:MAG: PIG-L family deacetylase [bacterium]|nr:PIG-L family deacetylase [bacterium]
MNFNLILPKTTNRNKSELAFFDKLFSYKTFLIFSPHLDDAALSMGSLLTDLARLNKDIKIVSLFTSGSSLYTSFNDRLLKQARVETAEEYFLARRDEDVKAIKEIGNMSVLHLGLVDAAWRANKDKKPFYPKKIIGNIHPEDDEVLSLIEQQINKLDYDRSTTAIFSPLARGRHVDHQIVRNAVTKIFPQVIYYSDFPYVNQFENENAFIKDHNLSSIEWHGEYKKKKTAILMYESQRVSLFQPKNLRLSHEVFYFH